jgi:hypothetical protein
VRTLPVVLALLALAGCGSERADAPKQPDPAVQGAAQPTESPPSLGGRDGPPPAWIETETGSHWLAFASYCWGSTCADYVGISERGDVPVVPVREGERVRVHLGFDPGDVSLSYGSTDRSIRHTRVGRVVEWRATVKGGIWLFARAAPGQNGTDASYVVKLSFRE